TAPGGLRRRRHGVDVGGVEERDAVLRRPVQDGERRPLVALVAEGHGPQANLRDFQAGAAEAARLHDTPPPRNALPAFLRRFGHLVLGLLSGFDRLPPHGTLRTLASAERLDLRAARRGPVPVVRDPQERRPPAPGGQVPRAETPAPAFGARPGRV